MNSESLATLERISSRLDEIEIVIEKGFKDIGTQLKEHARTLTFLSQTLQKSGLIGKIPVIHRRGLPIIELSMKRFEKMCIYL